MTRLTTLSLLVVLGSSTAAFAGPELTKAFILSILKDAKPDLDACGAGLKAEVVKTHFTIETSGDVADIKVDGKHGKDAVGSCIRAKLSGLKFGPSLKAMPINIPLRFGEAVAANDDAKSDKAADKAVDKAGGAKLDRKELGDLLAVLQTNMGSCGTGTTVQSRFTIEPSGQVRQVKIEGDHADDSVGKCVKTKLGRARFPEQKSAMPVAHEFRLE